LLADIDGRVASIVESDDSREFDLSVVDEVLKDNSEARSETARFSDSRESSVEPDQSYPAQDAAASSLNEILTQGDLSRIFGEENSEKEAIIETEAHEVESTTDVSAKDVNATESEEKLTTQDTKELLDELEDNLEDILFVADTDAELASREPVQSNAPTDTMGQLQRYLHTLKGGARMAGLRSVGDFTHELESYVVALSQENIEQNDESKKVLQASVDHIHHMLDDVQNGNPPRSAQNVLDSIHALMNGESISSEPIDEPIDEQEYLDEQVAEEHIEFTDAPLSAEVVSEENYEANSEIDSNVVVPIDVKSDSVPEHVAEHNDTEQDDAQQDFTTGEKVAAAAGAMAAMAAGHEMLTGQSLEASDSENDAVEDLADESESSVDSVFAYQPEVVPVQQRQQDVARISTSNLETLLNQAGEISIYRSRIEQELSNSNLNLAELARTIQRIKEQLRKMEIETEATILHQYREETDRGDFDPLEMDRYSNVQQLSRALAESVNDLHSLESLLELQIRETEALLLQQSRVMTDLQDNLMRVRMVPFARYAPRYARIVRQISNEIGKEVELNVSGADSEIDRQVIERMQAPLEHMIRNAVIHGIEKPEDRIAKNKDPEGTIELKLGRDGAQLLLELQDDGAGLDLDRIRTKALGLGLISSEQEITDADLAQLILTSGFSTATTVTQNAGRGVGMDVVASEIKQLGGSMQIFTEKDRGTRFLMRLPFTRAINHALLVRVGEENYALPIHKVDGVAKMSLSEVQRLLASENPIYRYADQDYQVKNLAQLVGLNNVAFDPDEQQLSVIMVTGGDHHAALVINELIGSREVVIKPVGPQITSIRGVSGATILGDGQIVIILDLDALLGVQLQDISVVEPLTEVADQALIMVVDDSITVRRVTERLLERNKMQVLTARDGLDALNVLQENMPDLILMDIEMPRMDGYELAEHVRKDERIKHIPIIMITSRTGDKHRNRAMEIGVDDYLGKPYREDQLLAAIEPHLNDKPSH